MTSSIKDQDTEWEKEFDKTFIKEFDVEGCQAGSDLCGKKDIDGKWLCDYCRRWNGPQRTRPGLDISEKTAKDFIRSLLSFQRKSLLSQLEKEVEKNRRRGQPPQFVHIDTTQKALGYNQALSDLLELIKRMGEKE